MLSSRILRQAVARGERTPMIKFVGPRSIPPSVDHSPKPHPASPTGKLPKSFAPYGNGSSASRHTSFSTYRDHAQQHGPLQKSIRRSDSGIGDSSGSQLGSIEPPRGAFFDVSDLPLRFRRTPIEPAEIEAVESGGAALVG